MNDIRCGMSFEGAHAGESVATGGYSYCEPGVISLPIGRQAVQGKQFSRIYVEAARDTPGEFTFMQGV